jgi:hypothetical protein
MDNTPQGQARPGISGRRLLSTGGASEPAGLATGSVRGGTTAGAATYRPYPPTSVGTTAVPFHDGPDADGRPVAGLLFVADHFTRFIRHEPSTVFAVTGGGRAGRLRRPASAGGMTCTACST